MSGCDVCGGDGLHRPNCKVVEQRMAAATTPPGSAKSAREVLAQHADALDHIDRIGGLGFRAHDVIAAARDALRALLSAAPAILARLEAGEELLKRALNISPDTLRLHVEMQHPTDKGEEAERRAVALRAINGDIRAFLAYSERAAKGGAGT